MRLKDMIEGKRDYEPFELLNAGICKLDSEFKSTYFGKKVFKFFNDEEEVLFFANGHRRAQVISSKLFNEQKEEDNTKTLTK